jgi:diguanylate cyclase (GGDEF)-like protein
VCSSDLSDEASILRAFEVGGSDYVTKPFRPRELLARVRIQLQYRRALEELRYLAVTDELTGIANRRAFFSRATVLFDESRSLDEGLAAMMLDLDHFKSINDNFGHTMGDLALQEFARQVSAQLRPGDLFGRLGGEEFAVIPPGLDLAETVLLAERIRRAVNKLDIEVGDERLRLTVSIGVAHEDEVISSLDKLLNAADQQLYRAKQSTKNCVRFREAELKPSTSLRRVRLRSR